MARSSRRRDPDPVTGPAFERQLGSMALSQIEGAGALALTRAVHWHNALVRLGHAVPLVAVHDVGCVVAGIGRPASVIRGPGSPVMLDRWRSLLVELAEAELCRVHAAWKHRDAMVAVVLAKVFAAIAPQLPEESRILRGRALPSDVAAYARVDPTEAYARYSQEVAVAWLTTLTEHRLLAILEIEQIDLDALRLLGLFRGGTDSPAGVDLSDLYSVVAAPGMADVIDFSMELIPSLLEVRRDAGQQTFSVDGYASMERRGNLDDLVLTQLAFDDDVFAQKFVDHELFYFSHEKQLEADAREHLVLVDGSASMRGVREVFARGLALALSKRLALLGEEVRLRFFDSRIYDGPVVGGTSVSEVPYVLQFKAERGRHYARVVSQLNAELSAPARAGKNTLVYLLTHGECHLPADEVAALAARVPLYGVFILPKHELKDPYLEHLHRVHVVDSAALSHGRRAGRARQIIDEVEASVGAASQTRRRRSVT